MTPLFIAAFEGRLEIVRSLVESGANKDQCTTDIGATPLYIAAQEGHLEVVRFLVESGANKDQCTTDIGATPLYVAARNGHFEIVGFLVESGANKDQGTTDIGATPLNVAAAKGHLEVVRFLVESGAQNGNLEVAISGGVGCQQKTKAPQMMEWLFFFAAQKWQLSTWSCRFLGSAQNRTKLFGRKKSWRPMVFALFDTAFSHGGSEWSFKSVHCVQRIAVPIWDQTTLMLSYFILTLIFSIHKWYVRAHTETESKK